MSFESFHLVSFVLFLLICGGGAFLLWRFRKLREIFKKRYTLLCNQNKYFYLRYFVLYVGLIILSFSLFGIKFGEKSEQTKQEGLDVVFVLDVSKSMNVVDVNYRNSSISRLNFAKSVIKNVIIDERENRYGLVIFAGDAISSSPLTFDHSTLLSFLTHINYENLSIQGTNLEKAFELGVDRLKAGDDDTRSKALILLSDGGDPDDTTDIPYIEDLIEESKIGTVVVGIGSKKGGKIPNGVDVFGRSVYQEYNGRQVISLLHEDTLKDIASGLKGDYIQAKDTKLLFAKTLLSSLEKTVIEIGETSSQKSMDRILAIVAFILFLFYLFFIPGRRSPHKLS